jgi:hypothetical protein
VGSLERAMVVRSGALAAARQARQAPQELQDTISQLLAASGGRMQLHEISVAYRDNTG